MVLQRGLQCCRPLPCHSSGLVTDAANVQGPSNTTSSGRCRLETSWHWIVRRRAFWSLVCIAVSGGVAGSLMQCNRRAVGLHLYMALSVAVRKSCCLSLTVMHGRVVRRLRSPCPCFPR